MCIRDRCTAVTVDKRFGDLVSIQSTSSLRWIGHRWWGRNVCLQQQLWSTPNSPAIVTYIFTGFLKTIVWFLYVCRNNLIWFWKNNNYDDKNSKNKEKNKIFVNKFINYIYPSIATAVSRIPHTRRFCCNNQHDANLFSTISSSVFSFHDLLRRRNVLGQISSSIRPTWPYVPYEALCIYGI